MEMVRYQKRWGFVEMIGVFIFVLGIMMGSFYNAVIYRIPRDIPISHGRSMCTTCQNTLKAWDLVPVFSWLFLRGKCRYCGQKISFRYPFFELFTGLLFLGLYLYFGYGWQLLMYLSFFSMLLITTVIDYEHMVVSETVLQICSVISGICLLLLKVDLWDHLYGALGGFGFYLLIYLCAKWFYKKEGFGFGDVILLAAIGLVLGFSHTMLCAFLSFYVALVGIIVMKLFGKKIHGRQEIPFGPYICIAATIVVFFGDGLMSFYTSIFK